MVKRKPTKARRDTDDDESHMKPGGDVIAELQAAIDKVKNAKLKGVMQAALDEIVTLRARDAESVKPAAANAPAGGGAVESAPAAPTTEEVKEHAMRGDLRNSTDQDDVPAHSPDSASKG